MGKINYTAWWRSIALSEAVVPKTRNRLVIIADLVEIKRAERGHIGIIMSNDETNALNKGDNNFVGTDCRKG